VGYVTPPALTRLQPDTADNYEIGAKARWRTASVIRPRSTISSAQHQEACSSRRWCCRPRSTPQCLQPRLEFELYALMTTHLTAQVDYTYDQTKLTALNPLFAYPNVVAPPAPVGSSLPGTPREQPGDRS